MRSTPLYVPVMLVLLALAAVAFGHGDDPHAEPVSDTTHAATPPVNSDEPNLDSVYALIQTNFQRVLPIVRRGCFDCHSTQTNYPWYHKLPLIGGWMDGHTEEAKEHLDMTAGFPFKGHARPVDDIHFMRKEVLDGDMPPWFYRIAHWSAKPAGADLDSLTAWFDTSLRMLAAHGQYPLGRADLVPTTDTATAK